MSFLSEDGVGAELTLVGLLLVVDDPDVLLQGRLRAALKTKRKEALAQRRHGLAGAES